MNTQKINQIILNETEVVDAVNFAELLAIGVTLGNNENAEFEQIMLDNDKFEAPEFA